MRSSKNSAPWRTRVLQALAFIGVGLMLCTGSEVALAQGTADSSDQRVKTEIEEAQEGGEAGQESGLFGSSPDSPEASAPPSSETEVAPSAMGDRASTAVGGDIAPFAAGDPFVCAPGDVYSVDGIGDGDATIRRVNTTTGATTDWGSFGQMTSSISQVNALAIAPDGQHAYALRARSNGNVELVQYTASTQDLEVLHTYEGGLGHNIVAGAFDPITGFYWAGGRLGNDGHEWRFTAYDVQDGVNLGQQFRFNLGHDAGQGDLEFDYEGNMYVVSTWGVDDRNRQNLWVIPKNTLDAAIAGPSSTTITTADGVRSLARLRPVDRTFHSVAWGSDGYLYTASSPNASAGQPRTLHRIDPLTGQNTNVGTIANGGRITDFAACTNPYTLTLQKNIQGRVLASDQFALEITGDDVSNATGVTSGDDLGLQLAAAEVAGPIVVLPGREYTIRETGANGADLSRYSSSYECVDTSKPGSPVIAQGAGSSGTFTYPSNEGMGANVVCTITNEPLPPEPQVCTPDGIYAQGADGHVAEWTGGTSWEMLPGRADQNDYVVGSGVNRQNINGLGIAEDGTMYGYARTGSAAPVGGQFVHHVGLMKTNEFGVWEKVDADPTDPNGWYNVGADIPIAGAVDLATDRYLFGGWGGSDADTGRMVLHELDGTDVSALGSVEGVGPAADSANGDFAFDAVGNLHIVRSPISGTNRTFTVTTVTYEALQAARANPGGVIPSATSSPVTVPGSGAVVGIAVDAEGALVLSTETNVWRVDPVTLQQIGSDLSSESMFSGSISDLASCATPTTLSIEKDVVARATEGDADQFTLQLTGDNGDVFREVTTAGSTTGIQVEQVPATLVRINGEYGFRELASGSTDFHNYTTSYQCTAPGIDDPISAGNATSGNIKIPQNAAGKHITCTFTNTPIPDTEFLLEKYGEDEFGADVLMDGSAWAVFADDGGELGDEVTGVVTPVDVETGRFTLTLSPGVYWLVETQAPEGFQLLAEPVAFTVTPSQEIVMSGADADSRPVALVEASDGSFTIQVYDVPAFDLPVAGGVGEWPFQLAGALLLLTALVAAGVLAIRSRRVRPMHALR